MGDTRVLFRVEGKAHRASRVGTACDGLAALEPGIEGVTGSAALEQLRGRGGIVDSVGRVRARAGRDASAVLPVKVGPWRALTILVQSLRTDLPIAALDEIVSSRAS